ncbi:MAG: hypothetical protein NTX50_00995 [Candidatus Sumerlaeota bacterium]|nr:hypothetical protein [Candidatus Sumerlaeota bacterium]
MPRVQMSKFSKIVLYLLPVYVIAMLALIFYSFIITVFKGPQ